ncbi:MAG: 1-deoxy-D-xylulose-5-phosphate reductoisomerase, partial [Synergistaceae bacterium]|nr:1-deoxy-D-xylulose-5-phosphate reductoisomerase [Synergistaceae bacterium]
MIPAGRTIGIAVIGATGSVGRAVLDICARFPERFRIMALAARSNADKLLELCARFRAPYAGLSISSAENAGDFQRRGTELLTGEGALESLVELPCVGHVVFASSGTGAITALQRALTADKDVSLANKESIVAAGQWVMPLVKRPDQLRPLDSEHSAIWQCLHGETRENAARIILTASGGPFRDFSIERMKDISPEDALRHPVWNMGAKITIDSSNLMNKGIECIEAMRLFGMPPDRVGALIHPSSQVHGIVEFNDGTMKLLFYRPDMRIPSLAALAWPERLSVAGIKELEPPDPEEWKFDFYPPDPVRFPCFGIA